jgi:glucose-1-phosphate cytidylyltransferase
MKVFILCGGFGTRLNHQGKLLSKTMIKIANEPILTHIIKNFSNQGFNEFVLCGGYKIETIKNYFLKKKIKILKKEKNFLSFNFNLNNQNILVDILYTGKDSGTGGRLKIAYKKLKMKDDFIATYGDGLSNVSVKKLINFHYKNQSELTLTAVRPKQRYGIIKINKNKVKFFDNSKSKSDVYINGGFFVVSKNIINSIKNNKIYLENEPFKKLIKRKKLFSFKHNGFWASMDTLKDKNDLDKLAKINKKLPWRFN